jgi:hypothetical protein
VASAVSKPENSTSKALSPRQALDRLLGLVPETRAALLKALREPELAAALVSLAGPDAAALVVAADACRAMEEMGAPAAPGAAQDEQHGQTGQRGRAAGALSGKPAKQPRYGAVQAGHA